MTILSPRAYWKPFTYPWAWEYATLQSRMHWVPQEVSLQDDIRDWNLKLTPAEKNLLTHLFRFFTQADVDVADNYYSTYLPKIHNPELRAMMGRFAAMEITHIEAYSYLLDTVGMPEQEYKAFSEYEAMKQKHEYNTQVHGFTFSPQMTLALDIIKNSVFGEGLQLFSSFAILLNFSRFGKMMGMGQIIAWSVRDESLHVEGMLKVLHTLIKEYDLDKRLLHQEAKSICKKVLELEYKFLDLCFELGGIDGLDKQQVIEYIDYIASHRLTQIGLNSVEKENPLPWVDQMVSGVEHANFFELRPTAYAEPIIDGEFSYDF